MSPPESKGSVWEALAQGEGGARRSPAVSPPTSYGLGPWEHLALQVASPAPPRAPAGVRPRPRRGARRVTGGAGAGGGGEAGRGGRVGGAGALERRRGDGDGGRKWTGWRAKVDGDGGRGRRDGRRGALFDAAEGGGVGARRAAVRARTAPAGRARGGGSSGAGLGFGRMSLCAHAAAGRVRWPGPRWAEGESGRTGGRKWTETEGEGGRAGGRKWTETEGAGPGSGGRPAEAGGASPTQARDPCPRARNSPVLTFLFQVVCFGYAAPRDPAGRRRQAGWALSALALEGAEPAPPPAAPAAPRSQPARAAGGAAQRALLLKGAGKMAPVPVPLGPSQWLTGPAEAQRARGGAGGGAGGAGGAGAGAGGGAARAGARGGMRIQSPPSGAKTPLSPDVEGSPSPAVVVRPRTRGGPGRLSRGVPGSARGGGGGGGVRRGAVFFGRRW